MARSNGGLQRLERAIKEAESRRPPAATLAAARKTVAAAEAALQKAGALMKGEQYLEAAAALQGLPERINEEITAVTEPRPARPQRRRS